MVSANLTEMRLLLIVSHSHAWFFDQQNVRAALYRSACMNMEKHKSLVLDGINS